MSHITGVDNTIFVSNLLALKQAVEAYCPELEFVEGASHYRTWKDNHNGRLVGDWPLPEGWTTEMVGENAVHVIRVKDEFFKGKNYDRNDSRAPYEIGIVPMSVERDEEGNVIKAVPDPNGTEYSLMTDWWSAGNGLLRLKGVGERRKVKDEATGNTREMAFGDLYMHYREMEIRQQAEANGDKIDTIETLPDGSMHVRTLSASAGEV